MDRKKVTENVVNIFGKQEEKELRFLFAYLLEHKEAFDFYPPGYMSKQGELWLLSTCLEKLKEAGYTVVDLEE